MRMFFFLRIRGYALQRHPENDTSTDCAVSPKELVDLKWEYLREFAEHIIIYNY
jgi:hypothetical protein